MRVAFLHAENGISDPAEERTTRAGVIVLWIQLAACSLMLMFLNNSVYCVCGPIRSLRWREPVSERTCIIYCGTGTGGSFRCIVPVLQQKLLTTKKWSQPSLWFQCRALSRCTFGWQVFSSCAACGPETDTAPSSFKRLVFRRIRKIAKSDY
jgi:hypothetical protein